MDLVREFGLPEDVVNEVKHHILVEEKSGLFTHPMLQLIPVPMEGQGGVYLCALIAGIDGSTTKKEWLSTWQQIKDRMQQLGIKTAPTKRDEDKISTRDLNWWGWSRNGLIPKDIADKWEEATGEACGEDTVRAAIKRIEGMMLPIK